MTISLILARRGKGRPDDEQVMIEEPATTEYVRNRQLVSRANTLEKVKGGTLIICPMALLGQWKVCPWKLAPTKMKYYLSMFDVSLCFSGRA